MIIWFGNQIVSPFTVDTSLVFRHFLTLSLVLPKTKLFISLKKSASKLFFAYFLSFAFMSIYYFNQSFWSNLMIL